MAETTMLTNARVAAVLRAEDYGRAKRFYEEKLGLHVVDFGPDAHEGMVESGSGTAFMIYERPGMPAPQNTTLSFNVTDIDATVSELRDRGVVFEDYDIPEIGLKTEGGISRHDARAEAWFKDSEGNVIVMSNM